MDFYTRVKDHARAHYNDGGWDVVYECWGREEVEIVVDECAGDLDEAWRIIEACVDVWADRQADARNSEF